MTTQQPPAGADVTIDALLAMMKRRRLLWEIMLGTVTKTGTGKFMGVVLDGDTAMTSVQSVIGVVGRGSRVVVIYAPPTGYYIVGFAGAPQAGWIDLVAPVSTVTVGPTVGTTELDLPTLAVNFIAQPGVLYEFWLQICLTQTVASDRFNVNARLDTPLTGTQTGFTIEGSTALNSPIMWPYLGADSGPHQVRFSIKLSSGSGVASVPMSPGNNIIRTWAGVRYGQAQPGAFRTA